MAYNVDSSRYLNGELYIQGTTAIRLRDELDHDLAECNPLEDMEATEEWVPMPCSWYGSWSGKGYEAFLTILKHTRGSADILLTWEGGDSLEGIRVVDGVLIPVELRMVLVAEGDTLPSTLPASRLSMIMQERTDAQ